MVFGCFSFRAGLSTLFEILSFLKIADFPKTYSLRELLFDLGKAYNKEKEIEKISKENIQVIADLEEAYITSRYLPVEFNKSQVKLMEKFTKDLKKFLKNL